VDKVVVQESPAYQVGKVVVVRLQPTKMVQTVVQILVVEVVVVVMLVHFLVQVVTVEVAQSY
jgi:hypothetical protein